MYLQEQLAKWEDYELTRSQLHSFVDASKQKLDGCLSLADEHTAMDSAPKTVADLVHCELSSAQLLLSEVDARRPQIEYLHSLSTALLDTASEARQESLRGELEGLRDADSVLTSSLSARISQLQVLDQQWADVNTRKEELLAAIEEKQFLLQETMQNQSLTPDQQYEIVNVSVCCMNHR